MREVRGMGLSEAFFCPGSAPIEVKVDIRTGSKTDNTSFIEEENRQWDRIGKDF